MNRFPAAPVKKRNPLAIISLVTMAGVAAYAIKSLQESVPPTGKECHPPALGRHGNAKSCPGLSRPGYPLWTMSSFAFTLLGGGFGAIWETFGGLNAGIAPTIKQFRAANVGLVMMSTMLMCSLVGGIHWDNRLTFALAMHGAGMWLNAYLDMHPDRTSMYIVASKALEIYLVVRRLPTASDAATAAAYRTLMSATLTNAASFVVSPFMPADFQSMVFHFVNAWSTYLAWQSMLALPASTLVPVPPISKRIVLGGIIVGFMFVVWYSRLNYNKARLVVTGTLWNIIYYLILSRGFAAPVAARLASPKDPMSIALRAYHINVPKATPLAVPNADAIPESQKLDYTLIRMLFKFVSLLDQYIPQARVNEPLKFKPRIRTDVTPDYYIPTIIGRTMTKMDMGIPRKLVADANRGYDITWMVLYGHLSCLLKRLTEADRQKVEGLEGCTHVIDLDWMLSYENKDDFMPYGGKAYFTYKDKKKKPYLTFLTLAGQRELIAIDVRDGRFEKARMGFLASSALIVVAGLHLAGIHMLYDLVSVSLFNAFDRAPHIHPFRAVMQLHFFNHTMVDVATTPHLMENGAVFTQIWALTHTGVCNFVEDYFYTKLEFGAESDLAARIDVLGEPKADSQLDWMQKYKTIFDEYAAAVVEAMYADAAGEARLANDDAMQVFFKALDSALRVTATRGLPARYGTLDTKDHLKMFISDCIFHVTVVHEMHGTKAPSYALNPQLMQVKVANDLSPPAREDFNSLLMVSSATARVQFPKLLDQNAQEIFKGVQEPIQHYFISAFDQMIRRLRQLEHRLRDRISENDDLDRIFVLPSDLETGAGY